MNNIQNNSPAGSEGMEKQLWDYIDGFSSAEEKTEMEKLLQANQQWKNKYQELLEVHQLMQSTELERPSLRFTKNVMEEIARLHIAPATKNYINKKIIWGIGGFFLTLIAGFLVYSFGQVEWTSGSGSPYTPDFSKIDLSKIFNNNFVNGFMMLNIVLGLALLDRVLANKRKKFHKEA
jgi:hypothetical protein